MLFIETRAGYIETHKKRRCHCVVKKKSYMLARIEDSQGHRIVVQKQALKIWENYVTELYDRPNRPETLEVEPEEEVDTDEKGPYISQSEVGKAIKEMRNRNATGDDDVPGDVLKFWEKVV